MNVQDKPISMPVKDYLIRILSVKLNTPEKTIEAIVNHQCQRALDKMATEYSVEFSGWGKFFFNHKKAQKKLEKFYSKLAMFKASLEKEGITEAKRISLNNKIADAERYIAVLKPKLEQWNERQRKTNSGGVEEQVDSPSRVEKAN